jgi:hypothetical protein
MDPANETARMTRATLDRRNGSYPQAIQELRSLLPGVNNPINRILQKHHTGARPDPRGPHSLQTLARIHQWLKRNPVAAWNEPAADDTGGIAFRGRELRCCYAGGGTTQNRLNQVFQFWSHG